MFQISILQTNNCNKFFHSTDLQQIYEIRFAKVETLWLEKELEDEEMFDWIAKLPKQALEEDIPCIDVLLGPRPINLQVSQLAYPLEQAIWVGEIVAVQPDDDEKSCEEFWLAKVIDAGPVSAHVHWLYKNEDNEYHTMPSKKEKVNSIPYGSILMFNVKLTKKKQLLKSTIAKIKDNL